MTFLQHFLITKVKGYSSSHNFVGGRWVSPKKGSFPRKGSSLKSFFTCSDNHERHVAVNEVERFVVVVVAVVVVGNYSRKFFLCKLAPLKHSLVDEWNFLVLVRGVR